MRRFGLFALLFTASQVLGQTPVWFRHFETESAVNGVASDSTGVYLCSEHLRKLSFAGQVLWERDVQSCRAVQADGTAVYILESRRVSLPSGDEFQVFALRYDRDGNALWERRLDPAPGFSFPGDLDVSPQGIFATFNPAVGTPTLTRLDAAGTILWSRPAGGPRALAAGVQFFNGTIYVAGQTPVAGVGDPFDLYLRRFDPAGNNVGTETLYDNNFRDFYNDFSVNATGVYLAGQSQTQLARAGNFLKRLTLTGAPVWTRVYDIPGTAFSVITGIELAADKIVMSFNTFANANLPGLALGAIVLADYSGVLESLTRLPATSPDNNIRAIHLRDRTVFVGGLADGTLPGNPPPPNISADREYIARFDLPPVAGPTTITGLIDTLGLPTGRANSYSNRVSAICQQLSNLLDSIQSDQASGLITQAQADPLLIAVDAARSAVGCIQ